MADLILARDYIANLSSDISLVAGVDEAGRGPLAGPVVTAAVILDSPIDGLNDSKKLSQKRRELLASEICLHAKCWGVGWACSTEIDQINILQATFAAMRRSVDALRLRPTMLFIDGNQYMGSGIKEQTVIKGDGIIQEIAAASILAKVARDRWMSQLSKHYPEYGFEQHKGYGTKQHLEALQQHGPIGEHRYSFAPVRNAA